jgi:hypothetical protein
MQSCHLKMVFFGESVFRRRIVGDNNSLESIVLHIFFVSRQFFSQILFFFFLSPQCLVRGKSAS